MHLIYLSEANLRDQFFIREFTMNFPVNKRLLLVNDHFGPKLEDTRFVTKRISALLSEKMVVNNAFSGDQRELVRKTPAGLQFRKELAEKLLETIYLLMLNPIVAGAAGPEAVPAPELLRLLIAELWIWSDRQRTWIALASGTALAVSLAFAFNLG